MHALLFKSVICTITNVYHVYAYLILFVALYLQQGQPLTGEQMNGSDSESERNPFASIPCNNSMFTASLYLIKKGRSLTRANGSPLKSGLSPGSFYVMLVPLSTRVVALYREIRG